MILLKPFKVIGFGMLALMVLNAGCTERACFYWTEAEGACPARADAPDFFADPNCGTSSIDSVDSEGVFEDDGVCCYDVTKKDGDVFDICEPQPIPPGPGPGVTVTVGSSSGGGFGGGGQGGFGAGGAGGSGGAGGGGVCIGCLAALSGGDTNSLCAVSLVFYQKLSDCQCTGVCSMACMDNQCMGAQPSMDCDTCTQDSVNGCGVELSECLSDTQ